MAKIKTYDQYPPIHHIFDLYKDEDKAVFLDSSLRSSLGRYSIIGIHPYLTLVQGDEFTVNGAVAAGSFEDYIHKSLKTHKQVNATKLPLISGAVGYLSYDYGLKKAGVATRHDDPLQIPEIIFCFYDVFIIDLNDHMLQVNFFTRFYPKLNLR